MIVGGSQIVAGATAAPVGSEPTSATSAYAITPATISDARRQQLLQGAAPTTAAEQQWTAQVEQALRGFVEWVKASGFVTGALERHGVSGTIVAPAAGGWTPGR